MKNCYFPAPKTFANNEQQKKAEHDYTLNKRELFVKEFK